MLSNILDRISFWSLFCVIVLLPAFFLPFTKIPVETAKGLLVVIGIVVSVIAWAAARFSDGKIYLPKSYISLGVLGVTISVLISSLISSSSKLSFFGVMLDVGTFWFMLSALVLMFMSSIMIRNENKARLILTGLALSSLFVFIFQIFRFVNPQALSFGVLSGNTANLLGSWYSLGLFAGLSAIISLFVVELISVSKKIKIFFSITSAISLVIVICVNLPLAWELIGLFSLLIFVYKISLSSNSNAEDTRAKFPVFSFSIVMLSLLFFMSGQFIGNIVPDKLGLVDLEISPSISSTITVAKSSLAEDPIFGIGPNKFSQAWGMYKPDIINSTQFWNTSFAFGSGLIPTLAITTGILGIIAWFVLLVLFVTSGVKSMFRAIKEKMNHESVLYFLIALYLLVASFFYASGIVLFLLAFTFMGVYIGVSVSSKENGITEISFLEDPRKSFFSILLLVLLMIVSAGLSFKYIERFASVSYLRTALIAENVEQAEASMQKAIQLHQNDFYFRTYAQIYLFKLNTLISKQTALTEDEKVLLQSYFDEAVNASNLAISYDKENYLNYDMLGAVYNTAAGLGVKDAYAKSIEAYLQASKLNPKNPVLKLAISKNYFADNKIKEAKDFAKESIALKPNYTLGLIFLSQLEKNQGNNTEAILYAEQALSTVPGDKDVLQYLNSLKGNGGNITPSTTTEPITETEKKEDKKTN